MQRRVAGSILGMAALVVAAGVSGWAQKEDTPIVILDGSLTMESAVPWSQFTGSGDRRGHPDGTRSVTKVVVTTPDTNKTIPFNNESCTVEVTYASAKITLSTGSNGKGLRVTPFGAFQDGDTPNRLAHKNQNAKISHIKVTKNGTTTFESDASGGTKIVISYQ